MNGITPELVDAHAERSDFGVVQMAASLAPDVILAESNRTSETSFEQIEINRLRCDVAYWRAMHRKAVEREELLKNEIEELKAKLSLRERQLFGRKSERRKGKTPDGGGQRGAKKTGRNRGQQPGAPGHGRRLQQGLLSKDVHHDFPDSEKCCPCCGLPFEEMPGTEDSEEVVVEVRAHRRVYKRKRYKPTCQCPGIPGIVTAPVPEKLIPKGSLHLSFWVMVLLDKFLFQRPTYRLLMDLRLTQGLDIPQGTVTGGLKRLTPLFEPLYEAIIIKNRSDSRWHADETRWLVFVELEGKQGHKWYLWVFRSQTTVVYVLDPSRSASVPKAHFGEKAEGIISADRYSAYKVLLKWCKLLIAFCWAHVRRDFLGVAKDWPKQNESWGLEWVDKIGELYGLNDQRLLVRDDPQDFAKADAELREAIDRMADERAAELADVNLHPARRKVLESMERHWSGLTLFVDHPEVPMDNSEAERLIRNPVVGRKNYYGSGSLWSGFLAAMLFSLFQTLLVWGINPRLWLTDYLQRCAECGCEPPEDAAAFLPWNLNDEQLSRYRNTAPQEHDTS